MAHLLVEYLINAAWQIPLMAAAALALCAVCGLAPRGQHRAWVVFLVLAVAAPALPIALPVIMTTFAPSPAALAGAILPLDPSAAPAPLARAPVAAPALSIGVSGRSAFLILTVFALAAALALARLAWAWAQARRLVRRSRAIALPPAVAESLARFAAARGMKAPRVRECGDVASPLVVGAIDPVVLTPPAFSALGEEEMRAALLHEFAHVLRGDYAVNLLCEIIALPVTWHPAVHALKGAIRQTRELACDAIASAEMVSQGAYARCLVSLARALGAHAQSREPAWIPGLFGRSNLEERIMRLLKPEAARSAGARTLRLIGGTGLAAAVLIPAMLLRVTPAFAQAPAPVARDAAPAAPPPVADPDWSAPARDAQTRPTNASPAIRRRPQGESIVISDDGSVRTGRLTPQERQRIDAMVARAKKQAMDAAGLVNSAEFKRSVAQAARQAALASMNSAEVQRQIAETVSQARLEASRAQIEAVRAQIETVEGPEIERQLADARSRIEAARARIEMLDRPDMQRRIAAATAVLKDPQFKKSMDQVRQQVDAALAKAAAEPAP